MRPKNTKLPIFDLHCDMLGYFAYLDKLDPMNADDIGCAIPHMQTGNVKLQTLAIFCPPKPGRKKPGPKQVYYYQKFIREYADYIEPLVRADGSLNLELGSKTKVVAAVENATGFCSERMSLKTGFKNLEKMISDCGKLLYIGFTHWSENRFGGGNDCHVGLKDDGKRLLDYLDGRQIAVDFAHASDELADGILTHIDKHKLDIRVIASHSNFRPVCNHERNLPDELTQEIIRRNGVIGMNFMRPYIDVNRADTLIDHILYGFKIGVENALSFGADFFYDKPLVTENNPDRIYHPEHRNASKFPVIVDQLRAHLSEEQLEKLCWRNAKRFICELWQVE